MPWGAQRNTEIVTKALKAWGGRAVVGKGWGGIKAEDLPDTVYSIDKAPHTRLFPLMKALVHHGGAGTTYAGLYAGKPTFVVPQFFDQPYWGRRVYRARLRAAAGAPAQAHPDASSPPRSTNCRPTRPTSSPPPSSATGCTTRMARTSPPTSSRRRSRAIPATSMNPTN